MARQGTRLTAKARALFLAQLAQHANVTRAAAAAGFSRMIAYDLRAKHDDFAAAWDAALEEAADKLEQEAWRRAHDGVPEPVVSMGKVLLNADGTPMTVLKYSDALLTTLLKAARPHKYRDNVNITAPQTNLGITVILEQMRGNRDLNKHAADFLGQLIAAQEVSE